VATAGEHVGRPSPAALETLGRAFAWSLPGAGAALTPLRAVVARLPREQLRPAREAAQGPRVLPTHLKQASVFSFPSTPP